MFVIYGVVSNFDHRIWEATSIFALLMGIGSPRDPKGLGERVMFICTLFAGISFGEDIFVGSTNFNVPWKIEVEIEKFEDMKQYNLTPYISQKSFELMIRFESEERRQWILETFKLIDNEKLKNDYKVPQEVDCYLKLMMHNNVSCPVGDDHIKIVRDVLSFKLPPAGKIIDLNYRSSIRVHMLRPFSPFVNRINDIHWRISEVGIETFAKNEKNAIMRKYVYNKLLEHFASSEADDSDETDDSDSLEAGKLIFLLSVGLIMSLFCIL